jgi:serine carboxypeptidase-like clade 1
VRLSRNPYAWSSVANIVYLDSPAGVGLSYSDTVADYKTNDTATARDADVFLRALVTRYPAMATRELYIAGESYAGIYVPNLARAVLAGNAAGAQPALNLVGYAVGNGCTDAAFDGNALVPFAAGKSLISADLAASAAAACDGGAGYWNASAGSACARALDDVDALLRGLNLYDTLEDCVGRGAADALPLPTVGRAWPLRATLPPPGSPLRNWASLGVTVPCMDTSLATAWLNAPDVRDALHAAPVATTGPFAICSNAIRYTHDAGSMLPVHAALLRAGLRALIYSGDHDMCVRFAGLALLACFLTRSCACYASGACRTRAPRRGRARWGCLWTRSGARGTRRRRRSLATLAASRAASPTRRSRARGTPCRRTSRCRRWPCFRASWTKSGCS